jgi:hypothetical protein
MRRGLMGWNAEELPVAVLQARLARLRTAMAKAGMDAFVLYTNNTRPAAVAHVTGFTPYWSDALMLVPRTGAPVFATALSKRVSEWIRTTDPLSEIVNTPRPGALMGERLAQDASVKRVGVLEYDTLPAGLAGDMAAAAPTVAWADGTALFSGLRREVDDAERGLLKHANVLAVAARSQVWSSRTRGSPARRKRISRSLPISSQTAGSTAHRSRRRSLRGTPCAPRSPTRAAGSAARGHSPRMRQKPMPGSTASCARLRPANRSRRSLRRR